MDKFSISSHRGIPMTKKEIKKELLGIFLLLDCEVPKNKDITEGDFTSIRVCIKSLLHDIDSYKREVKILQKIIDDLQKGR